MPKYAYYAKTRAGEQKKGYVTAISEDTAVSTLQSHGLIVISVQNTEKRSLLEGGEIKLFNKVSDREMVVFSRLLATLLEVQVPLMEAISILQGQTKNKYFQKVLSQVIASIEDGNLLSESLSGHPKVFSRLYIAMIQSGEASGSLGASLLFMADYFEEQYALNSKIKGALMYPTFILIIFVTIALLVAYFVLPQLLVVLEDLDPEAIPTSTRIIMWMSEIIQEYIILILLAIAGMVAGVIAFLKSPGGARFWDKWQLKVPVFGNLFTKMYVARFSSNMKTLLEGGIPILSALKISSEVVRNRVYQKIIQEAIKEIKNGSPMSSAFIKHKEFPDIAGQIMKIGEKTGRVESVLDTLTSFYKREVDDVVNNLTTLIEPFMIVFLGLGVGIFVLAILGPIYNITGSI